MGFLRDPMVDSSPIKIALLFPGQGSQYVGMGEKMAEAFPKADLIFQKANDILGMDLRKICFEGPESELVLTHNSQPAILTSSIACWEVFKECGIEVEVLGCAGLSLGEYSALVAAGVLRFEDALPLVRDRGTFMQEACNLAPSGMVSILGLSCDDVAGLCREIGGNGSSLVLDVANVNSPGQIVVSGHHAALAKIVERVGTMDAARAIPLNVSGAFHSRLMQSAACNLNGMIRRYPFQTARIPVFANVTGKGIGQEDDIADLLVRQVTSSVLWEQCVRSILSLQPAVFLEPGCGRVLSGLLRKIDRSAKSCSIEDPESLSKTIEQMKAIASSSQTGL